MFYIICEGREICSLFSYCGQYSALGVVSHVNHDTGAGYIKAEILTQNRLHRATWIQEAMRRNAAMTQETIIMEQNHVLAGIYRGMEHYINLFSRVLHVFRVC